jgi:hypothetical protein
MTFDEIHEMFQDDADHQSETFLQIVNADAGRYIDQFDVAAGDKPFGMESAYRAMPYGEALGFDKISASH